MSLSPVMYDEKDGKLRASVILHIGASNEGVYMRVDMKLEPGDNVERAKAALRVRLGEYLREAITMDEWGHACAAVN